MDAQQILDRIKNKTFSGYATPHHPDVELILSPQKLVIKMPGQLDREIFYDDNYNPILLQEGKRENKNLTNDSFVRGQYLFRDPRFCLQNAQDFKELRPDLYSMVIWREKVILLGKFHIEAEIEIINDNKFIMTTKRFRSKRFRKAKEIKSQRGVAEFSA